MHIIRPTLSAALQPTPAPVDAGYCATIGFFDGVHLGHQFLLRQVEAEAAERCLRSMAVTFEEHPRAALDSQYQPRLLGTTDDKLTWLAATGINACALLRFDRAMAQLSAANFMREYLQQQLGVRCLVIGYDHHFGHNRQEGFEDYVRYGRALGMDVVAALPLETCDFTVSSSAIRRFLDAGHVERAAEGLGRPFSLRGTVTAGRRVGRRIGFPTANLRPADPHLLVPRIGVYAVWAEITEGRFPAMLNIGRRPTLNNGSDISIEAHLIGFNGNLYNQPLTLHFVRRLRDEMTFPSLESLTQQLEQDAHEALLALK